MKYYAHTLSIELPTREDLELLEAIKNNYQGLKVDAYYEGDEWCCNWATIRSEGYVGAYDILREHGIKYDEKWYVSDGMEVVY